MPRDIFELARERHLQVSEPTADGGDWRVGPTSTAVIPSSDIVNASAESTLLLCGSPACGKSELLRRFLSKDATHSSLGQEGEVRAAVGGGGGRSEMGTLSSGDEKTVALEYNFGRRQRGGSVKELAHIWELGGGGKFSSLLAVVLNERDGSNATTSLVLMLDPTAVEDWPGVVLPLMDAITMGLGRLTNAKKQPSHPATTTLSDRINPLPLTLCILLARHDQFQQMDTERKRNIHRLLRYLAHYTGATTLAAYSNRVEALASQGRVLLAQMAFPSLRSNRTGEIHAVKPAMIDDPHAAIFVPAGADSFETSEEMLQRIGFSPNPLLGDGIARWAEELQRHYPNANIGDTKSAQNGDPDFDDPDEEKFAEPAVDSVVEEGRRALEIFVRERRDRETAEGRSRHKHVMNVEEELDD